MGTNRGPWCEASSALEMLSVQRWTSHQGTGGEFYSLDTTGGKRMSEPVQPVEAVRDRIARLVEEFALLEELARTGDNSPETQERVRNAAFEAMEIFMIDMSSRAQTVMELTGMTQFPMMPCEKTLNLIARSNDIGALFSQREEGSDHDGPGTTGPVG